MRLFLDLQAIQGASAKRGIGRYSFELAKAIARNAGDHEVWLGFSERLPVPWPAIAEICGDRVPPDHVAVMALPGQSAELWRENRGRTRIAELVREGAIAELEPDVIHVSSLFEGLGEDNTTSVAAFESPPATSVTLYDLIPYIRPEAYLTGKALRGWYQRKIDWLLRADRLLAISESAKHEAVGHLGIAENRIAVVRPGVAEYFHPTTGPDPKLDATLQRLGLTQPFVLYTGGIEPRKNIEGLIEAYARLASHLRTSRQLAIVCAVTEPHRERLSAMAHSHGMQPRELVLTGFVTDHDLRTLYRACELFVFPSLHEGFGLPVVEAMACGAPVIASDNSSMPEIIERKDALFDATMPASIAAKIEEVLTNPGFALSLRRSGELNARRFTWDNAGRSAWTAFEATHANRRPTIASPSVSKARKLSLAYFSPLPPEPTGVSDYSSALLPELVNYYEITPIVAQNKVKDRWVAANLMVRDVAWFERNAHRFERILYNIGNSLFHTHMLELVERWPGAVVLHDFYLSALFRRLGTSKHPTEWFRRLYDSHGLPAVRAFPAMKDSEAAAWALPCSRLVFEHATGVIVHSHHARELARQFFGARAAERIAVVPFPRHLPKDHRRAAFRREIGLRDSDLLVCSFGFLSETKLNTRLIDTWLRLGLDKRGDCHLHFVGNLPQGAYEQSLRERISHAAGDRITITGFVDPSVYRGYLDACDVAVQLRSSSRGEFPATAMDCLAHGIPLIVNEHGAMAEIPRDCAVLIPDGFSDDQLAEAVWHLLSDQETRTRLALSGRAEVETHNQPGLIAEKLCNLIDRFERGPNARTSRLLSRIAVLAPDIAPLDLAATASAIGHNRRSTLVSELLIDVSALHASGPRSGGGQIAAGLIDRLMRKAPARFRPELVTVEGEGVYYARSFAERYFDLPSLGRDDAPARLAPGDAFLGIAENPRMLPASLDRLCQRNVQVNIILWEAQTAENMEPCSAAFDWLSRAAAYADRVICTSSLQADAFLVWLRDQRPARFFPLEIAVVQFDQAAEAVFNSPTAATSTVMNASVSQNNWEESIAQLTSAICGSQAYRLWIPPSGPRSG